jgi:UDP:flavonoid glycosyltransferase YjiC (YdhE family)
LTESKYKAVKEYKIFLASTIMSLRRSFFWDVMQCRLVPTSITLHLTKICSQELQKFLDEAEAGVIYFSLGSNVRSDNMPEEKRHAFLEAFSTLPQKIIWKWESDILPGQPPNVKLGKWFPQQDILGNMFFVSDRLCSCEHKSVMPT